MAPHPDDDLSIANDCKLYRRITEHQMQPDGVGVRISSAALTESSDGSGTSVHLEDEMRRHGVKPHTIVDQYGEGTWLAWLEASVPRGEGLWLARSPEPDDPTHGEIRGKRSTKKRGRMLKLMRWEIGPPNAVDPADV